MSVGKKFYFRGMETSSDVTGMKMEKVLTNDIALKVAGKFFEFEPIDPFPVYVFPGKVGLVVGREVKTGNLVCVRYMWDMDAGGTFFAHSIDK